MPSIYNIPSWNRLTAALKANDAQATSRAVDALRAQGWRYKDMQQHATSTLGMSSIEFENRMAEAEDYQ